MSQYLKRKNLFFTVSTRFFIVLLGFATSIITARFLGPANRGAYFFVITTAAILTQFSNFGIQSSNTYLAAQDETRLGSLVSNSFWLSLSLGLTFSVLSLVVLALFRHLHLTELGNLLFVLILVPTNLFFLFGGNLLVAINRIQTYNLLQFGSSFIIVMCMLLMSIFLRTVKGFLIASALGWIITAIILFIIFIKLTVVKFRFDKMIFISGMRYSIKAYLATLLGYLVLKSNIYILHAYHGNQAVGYFSIASQINDVMSLMPTTFALLLFPQLVKNHDSRWREAKKNIWIMAGIMLLACIIASILVKPFILFVYGKAYFSSISVLLWMLPGIFFLGVLNIATQYLAAIGFPKMLVLVWGIAFLVMIVSSLILIPRFSEDGAGMALSISYLILFCIILFLFYRYRTN